MGLCLKKQSFQEEDDDVDRPQPAPDTEIPEFSSGNVELPTTSLPSDTPMASCSSPIDDPEGLIPAAYNLRSFTFEELKAATKNFRLYDMIGEGSFAYVYRGMIHNLITPIDFTEVSVKHMSKQNYQMHEQWLAEVNILSQLSHPNIVELIGYCQEDGHHLLVYEYMSNGSLDRHLFNSQQTLPWPIRIKIALAVARGLHYLHKREPPVIFGGVKSANILLDENYNAKLTDFGNAMEIPTDGSAQVPTRARGTPGYIDPGTGPLTVKSDVYRFGVVLLELLTGRKSLDKRKPKNQQLLVNWATPYLQHEDRGMMYQIVDHMLGDKYGRESAHMLALIATKCIMNENERPEMGSVVQTLDKLK